MCGIVGILARRTRVAPEVLERATRSLAHRGPDDSGTLILRANTPEPVEVGLGNRRLAVIDLSALGHQPMQDAATGNCIVYNGEIYNFHEVREKLEGEKFVSHSDTEVVLKAYGRWGERCLDQLRGMFAFAIWDVARQRLFLARDPMGIKPLYYYSSEEHFLFASEVRTLLGTGIVPRRLDDGGLRNYLTFGSVYDPNTLIDGVSALLPGHYLTWEQGTLRNRRYWDLVPEEVQSVAPPAEAHRAAIQNDVRDLLRESAKLQLVSDVPVGIFLSGGIDSSVLVALLAESGTRLNSFSLTFGEAEYDESEYSRMVAKKFGTEHQEMCVSQQEALASIPGALQAMDQPTIDGVNTFLIARQARASGIKVALSGLGGDELFGGYASFRTVPRMEQFWQRWQHVPGFLRSLFASAVLPSAGDDKRKLAALARDSERIVHPYFLSRMLFTPEQVDRHLRTGDQQSVEKASAPLLAALQGTRNLDPVNRVSYLESRCYMANTLLRDADFMSMAHGLELRVPLIDHRLAELLMTIPGNFKLDARTQKSLLIGAVGDALPQQVVQRKKQGFTLPFEHWLRDELRPLVEPSLREISQGLLGSKLNGDEAREVWESFVAGRTSWSRPWSLFVLSKWCDLHLHS